MKTINIHKWRGSFLILLIFSSFTLANKIIYVDDDAFGSNDGSSWENAYIYLQDALADAETAEKPVEIRVAQGIYKPDMGAGITAGDREASFETISGVALSGGYAGIFEPNPNERDYEKYETILSGDLAGNDVYINDPNDLIDEPTRQENSYYVIITDWPDSASKLDGFTVSGGQGKIGTYGGRGSTGRKGGGIKMGSGKLRICNCYFTNNLSIYGAGIYVESYGQIILINCIFKANAASNGGGIYNDGKLKLAKCIFENNFADEAGGGIYSEDDKINIENTSFTNNSASYGGAVYLHNIYSDSSLTNCLFAGNSAENNGGAIYIIEQYGNSMEITHSTFAQNSALHGKAIFSSSDIKISNSILYNGGQNEIWNTTTSNIEVCYSNIQNGQSAIYDPNGVLVWGYGNIDTDPLFADANNGDYHLKSQAGRFDSVIESWVIDSNTSPCIDAGDPFSPIGLEAFPNGGYTNMGAYGGTSEASKSYFGKPVCETIIAGDINGDCIVDINDFEIMMIHWLEDNNPVSVKVIEGVEFRVQTDKTFYQQGENVQMEFTVTNMNNETVNIQCSRSPVYNLSVEKDGEELWFWVHGGLWDGLGIEFLAGESKGISHSWDMKDDDDYLVGPGTHHIVGIMYTYRFDPENPGPTEVRIPITISAGTAP